MAERKSAIRGTDGNYGVSHYWRYDGTAQVGGAPAAARRSEYHCEDCAAEFTHRYELEPNIFAAMRRAGIADRCPGPAPAPLAGQAQAKSPVRAPVRDLLAAYAAGEPADLSQTNFQYLAAYMEHGASHPRLGVARADFGYELAELDALRAAGKTARDVAAEVAARGAERSTG